MSSSERFQVRLVRSSGQGRGRPDRPRGVSEDYYAIVDTHRSDAEVARYPLAGRDTDAVYYTARDAAQQRNRNHGASAGRGTG